MTSEKLEAAESIYRRARGWVLCDGILDSLRKSDHRNQDLPIVRLKVDVLNVLYQTRLLATGKMAQHIVAVMKDNRLAGSALVEKVAVPQLKKRMHFRSFASKFCHFFVDSEVYAIMDNRNASALECHLGQKEFLVSKMLGNYELFCSGLNHLRRRDSIGASHRALDHYLYLWELLRRYRKSQPIAYEIAALFEEAGTDNELRQALVTLEGS